MRSLPASAFKKSRRRGPNLHSEPRAGTKLRVIYDIFLASKGQVIELPISVMAKGNGRTVADLCDYYGLDIRNLGYRKWVLAGEWFGKVCVDYVAEHLSSDQERAA